MQRIGLTGGIGTGKSMVGKIFEMLGIPVFYADLEAHRIRNRPEITKQIIQHFGRPIVTKDHIDKRKLAEVIFNDIDALHWINKLIHPLVEKAFDEWCNVLEATGTPFVIMESAVIFEARYERLFDRIIAVETPQLLQIANVMNRDKISEQDVLQRISMQMPAAEKCQKANIIVRNDEQHSLIEQVAKIKSDMLDKQAYTH